MTRTNQGGSVWSFVIVAIVLAGLLVGGAYTIRKLTAQPDQSQPPAPAQQDQSSDKTDKTAPQTGSDTPSQAQNSTPTPPSNTQAQTSQNSSPAQLPQTGPEGMMGAVIAVAALSGMAVSYARSRRPELLL